MRLWTPDDHLTRVTTRDLTTDGVTIPAGARVILLIGAANRDPAVFRDPGEFRLDRKPNRQIAFGFGPHMCIGQHLAKQELRVMLEELLPRLVSLEITGDRRVVQTNFVGGLRRLPMRLELA